MVSVGYPISPPFSRTSTTFRMSLVCGFLKLIVMIMGLTLSLQFFYTHPFNKTLMKVRGTQIIHLHLFVARRGVDKFVVPDIDSYMGIIRPGGLKKDQIPFLQLVLINLSTKRKLFSNRSGKIDIKNFIDLFHKGRTINPLQGGASQSMGSA